MVKSDISMGKLAVLEHQVANEGLNRSSLLEFLRLLPTSNAKAIKETLKFWVAQIKDAGIEVDDTYVERILDDIDKLGHISHETVIGAESRPDIELL